MGADNIKLKLKHFIPVYGLKRYVEENKFYTAEEARKATLQGVPLMYYHLIVCCGALVGFTAALDGLEKLLK